jgi:HSP20 family protein
MGSGVQPYHETVNSKEGVIVLEKWRPLALRPHWYARGLDEMERYMDEMLGGWPLRTWRRMPGEEVSWSPAVEMYEKEDKFVVRTELPGVKKDEIDITMLGDNLTIRGERKVSEDVKDDEYHRCEVCYGSFSRSITIPVAVDAKKIEAVFEDGILEVALPKAKEVKPSKITIKAKETQQKAKGS